MDLDLHSEVTESYKLFQGRIQNEYEKIVGEFGLEVMDATRPVEVQQRLLRQMVTPWLPTTPGTVVRGTGGAR